LSSLRSESGLINGYVMLCYVVIHFTKTIRANILRWAQTVR